MPRRLAILLMAPLAVGSFALTRHAVNGRSPEPAQDRTAVASALAATSRVGSPPPAPGISLDLAFEQKQEQPNLFAIRVTDLEGSAKQVTSAVTLFDYLGETVGEEAHGPVEALAPDGSTVITSVALPPTLPDGYYRANAVVGWKEAADTGGDIGGLDRDLYIQVKNQKAKVLDAQKWHLHTGVLISRKKG